ncbi:PIN domain-containing protein [Moraxella osloensis]|uniref:PIN domain-containing protein n=1 Tax=Faucicola osloensis TaxID=34062 RepID=UPI0016665AE3|nr:PIN domain-containing protein [Moraxella osloensis]
MFNLLIQIGTHPNILVGACLGSRYDNLVIRGCLTGDFKPLVSHALLFEYEDLIGRESVFDHPVALNFEEREILFNALYSVCRLIDVSYLWRPNLKDEGDNFIVELAVAGNADYIVTKNLKDFRQSELVFDSFKVITPKQLLENPDVRYHT